MNIAKNMEIIFVATLALASATGFAHADSASKRMGPPEVVKVGAAPTMTVITVTAKRLTAAEKAAFTN